MQSGNDYAELCDLGPSRWSSSSRNYHNPQPHSSLHHTSTSASTSHIRSNSFEAEDIIEPYGNSRINNSTSSLRGGIGAGVSASSGVIGGSGGGGGVGGGGARSGLYYSPTGTSYTIVERPNSPHYYYNTAGGTQSKGGSLPNRGHYLGGSSAHISTNAFEASSSVIGGGGVTGSTTISAASRHNANKKRPISPEQVLRLFGTTTSSSSAPSNYNSNGSGVTRDRGRRSPASSPPSTTHQVNKTIRERERERERDRSATNIHELATRTVTMSRDQQDTHGFGICVKGGKDAGLGVYISRIEEGSLAERSGLRPGDTILEVNGTPFTTVSHDEALKILKSSRQISMTVRAPPMLNTTAPLHGFGPPLRDAYNQPSRQTCSWMDRHGRPASPPMEYGGRKHDRRDRIRNVELLIEPGQSLGLMIRGGVEYGLGIFITGVDKESVADRAGLLIGDQILEVNGQSFLDVTHDEAVSQLKYHKRMSLLVRDVGKVPHSCTSIEPEPWDAYSPTEPRNRRKCPISAMVEEKARSLLPRHNFASLSYYINEYGSRGMTIDAFVSVLLEMLDTPEKHTLVTEIRELVFPEDRTRYDELVYSRDPYLNERDRHRDYLSNGIRSNRGSESQLTRTEYGHDPGGYFEGIRSHLGGLTQRVKSWYWGRPLELATKLSRSFDMKEETGNLLGDNMRRHQSMQRLSAEHPNGLSNDPNQEHNPNVVPDHRGNLHITVKKTKPILGIAIEGGANTKHPLPRIINIHEHGAAYETGGLEVGQLILQVDGNKVEGMHHQDVARLIAECFANPDKADIAFLVVEAKKSNLEPKPTALIFLEA